MITLVWPWVFLLLPLPWLVRRWATPAENPSTVALRVPQYADMMQGTPGLKPSEGHAPSTRWVWVGLGIWVLLILAGTRPQWVGEPVGLPTSGRDLMLAVDLSGSMKIPDFTLNGQETTRLEVVKSVASEFIAGRDGDRLGLVVFGSQAYVQTPLTFDRHTVQAMLNETEIGIAGQETAIGDAIGLAVKRLKEQPAGSRVLVLLTDGANTTGEVPPKQAADLARKEGIRIYTIGIGADSMDVSSLFGTRTVNPSRDLDEHLLRHIAQQTGGLYLRAKHTQALIDIYRELDRLEPASTDTEMFRPREELYMWPLGIGLVVSMGFAMYSIWVSGFRMGIRVQPLPRTPLEET